MKLTLFPGYPSRLPALSIDFILGYVILLPALTLGFIPSYLSLMPDLNSDLYLPTVPATSSICCTVTAVYFPTSDLLPVTFLSPSPWS